MPYFALVVDGDGSAQKTLGAALKGEFEVATCGLAREALDHLRSTRPPDIIVVDCDLPDMEGLTFLKVLRETELGRNLAVILTGKRNSDELVLEAFNIGIDDHLPKPFDLREMLVRIRAVLRRRYERHEHFGNALTVGPIEIDPSQRLCLISGKRITLQPREFELLEILMRKAGRVLSRVYLLETVWGMRHTAHTRAVDVMISRLRRRLGGRGGHMIETVSKLGYCLRSS
jgi:DNA-binding response OmpR family regulator